MSVTDNVRKIAQEAEPLIEQWLGAADQLAALRDVAKEKGIDWSALKALLVARVRDNEDGGERLKKIAEQADLKLTYADMLSKPIVAERLKNSATISESQSAASSPQQRASADTGPEPRGAGPINSDLADENDPLNGLPPGADRRHELTAR